MSDPSTPPIEMDLSRWPVIMTAVPAVVSDDSLREFTERITEVIRKRAEPYMTITDLRGSADLSYAQREMLSDAMNRQATHAACLGAGLVLDSRLMALMIKGALIIRKPPHDTRVFTDMDTATRWAEVVTSRARKVG